MIPLLAHVRIRRFHLWIPLILVWVLLLPVALLVLPFFLLACVAGQVSIARAFDGLWRTFCALRGTRVEVGHGRASVLLSIS